MTEVEPVDPWARLRGATPARIGLARAGASLSTSDRLRFQLDHARARDAVAAEPDAAGAAAALRSLGVAAVVARSRAATLEEHLRRPDLGRRLHAEDASALARTAPTLAVVLAGGLSPAALGTIGVPVAAEVARRLDWSVGPVVVVGHGRVALGDEVGERLGASLALVLIGERPGLSAPVSLGAYVTWSPRIGRTDAERECTSNIRVGGLEPADAVDTVVEVLVACRSAGASGVARDLR